MKKFNYVKYIEKELNKKSSLCIKHMPTEDEKIYLNSKNITYTFVTRKFQGIISDRYYETKYCLYTKN